jgi:hypothetical protein
VHPAIKVARRTRCSQGAGVRPLVQRPGKIQIEVVTAWGTGIAGLVFVGGVSTTRLLAIAARMGWLKCGNNGTEEQTAAEALLEDVGTADLRSGAIVDAFSPFSDPA